MTWHALTFLNYCAQKDGLKYIKPDISFEAKTISMDINSNDDLKKRLLGKEFSFVDKNRIYYTFFGKIFTLFFYYR